VAKAPTRPYSLSLLLSSPVIIRRQSSYSITDKIEQIGQHHHEVNRQFWHWSDAAVDPAVLTGSLRTVYGWPIHLDEDFNAPLAAQLP